jgi:quercetin dioxygenase-like cupin family protein
VIALNVNELELVEGWVEAEPSTRGRFDFPIHAGVGATSAAAIYFEVEPGDRIPWHVHTAEEIIFVVAGEAEGEVGDERGRLSAGGLVLVPAHMRHRVTNAGTVTLRVLGFFSSAAVMTTLEDEIVPMGTRVLPIPPPDYLVQSEQDRVEGDVRR